MKMHFTDVYKHTKSMKEDIMIEIMAVIRFSLL